MKYSLYYRGNITENDKMTSNAYSAYHKQLHVNGMNNSDK